ncbi:hypothetical protein [Candidatus Nitronereus thalassa]|uniref:Uncharacterized protein n=1 Tax=Candidatus Nitronereus thalassa TaxID=3020898 RepID=A0ABU3K4R7_9BACT|nr:hypothetical protein [Candidatus Nitronereus thalassa]MDT7041364.1 hypothetical protein [Candidatus Nitronereus thalassa]
MGKKKMLLSFFVGVFLLTGTGSAFAAFWDRPCQFAIEELQFLQKQIAEKKQEVDHARVASTIPASFFSDQVKDSMVKDQAAQTVEELKSLFQDVEVAVSELNKWCLASNRVAQ